MDWSSVELNLDWPKVEIWTMKLGLTGVAERLLMAVICVLLAAAGLVIFALAAFGRLVRKYVWL